VKEPEAQKHERLFNDQNSMHTPQDSMWVSASNFLAGNNSIRNFLGEHGVEGMGSVGMHNSNFMHHFEERRRHEDSRMFMRNHFSHLQSPKPEPESYSIFTPKKPKQESDMKPVMQKEEEEDESEPEEVSDKPRGSPIPTPE